MKEVDAVELVEKTSLAGLADLHTDVVYTHVDFLGRELPGPIDLYQRWERQQWSATEIDFTNDRRQWDGPTRASAISWRARSAASSTGSRPSPTRCRRS